MPTMPEFNPNALNAAEYAAWLERLERFKGDIFEALFLFNSLYTDVLRLRGMGVPPGEIEAGLAQNRNSTPEFIALSPEHQNNATLLFDAMVRQAIQHTDPEQPHDRI